MVTAFWKICSGLAVVSTFFLVGGVKAQEPSSEQKQEVLTPAQLLEEQNKKFQALESLAHVMNILNTKYVDEKAVPNDVLVEKAIKGIVSGLDPHTIYLSPAELKDFQSDTMGKFGGVGIVISADTTFPEIVEILPDSPAASSGLKVGDVIVSIEGIAINSKNRDDLLTRIRGLANTELVIEIIEANAFAAEQMKGKKPDIEA